MHERSKERAGARVKYFNLAGGRLAPLSRHDQNHARRLLLAGTATAPSRTVTRATAPGRTARSRTDARATAPVGRLRAVMATPPTDRSRDGLAPRPDRLGVRSGGNTALSRTPSPKRRADGQRAARSDPPPPLPDRLSFTRGLRKEVLVSPSQRKHSTVRRSWLTSLRRLSRHGPRAQLHRAADLMASGGLLSMP